MSQYVLGLQLMIMQDIFFVYANHVLQLNNHFLISVLYSLHRRPIRCQILRCSAIREQGASLATLL